MIDYETYCKIHQGHRKGLKIVQIARALGMHPETVSKWLRVEHYRQRHRAAPRASCLDPYKSLILRWITEHPLSAQQVFQRLREAGYTGGISILKDYIREIRPPQHKSFLKLSFAAGEC